MTSEVRDTGAGKIATFLDTIMPESDNFHRVRDKDWLGDIHSPIVPWRAIQGDGQG